jgi:NAD(P)-dependent dehydrogenase (short-subunit alcohol dehydrogenase family)
MRVNAQIISYASLYSNIRCLVRARQPLEEPSHARQTHRPGHRGQSRSRTSGRNGTCGERHYGAGWIEQFRAPEAAERIRKEFGRLDLLINNAAISNTRKGSLSLPEYAKISRPSNVSLDEVRAVWETNVFGVLAVFQAMLPLLRESSDARIVNVSSAVGSLTSNADPAYPYHPMFGPVYPASKAALNAITLAMMVELELTGIKVNLVSPGFTKTNLNGFAGTQSVEEGSREVVRVALLGPDGPSGTFTRWENAAIPW